MPALLIVVASALMGLISTHQRHYRRFSGSSQGYRAALGFSSLVGTIVLVGLFVFYGYQTTWYLPILLFVICLILSGIVFGILDAKVDPMIMGMSSFVLWPVAAIYTGFLIAEIKI